jgi:Terminase RNaseH-like domain
VRVLEGRKRFTWLSAGRRWRKTTLAVSLAGEAAIAGDPILWGAPTFGQCEIGWREMQRACGGAAHFARNRMEVTFPTGGTVTFRSLDDPDNARGLTAFGVVLDEAPLIQQRAWYEVIRPIISDTDGWAFLMGTPKGKNYFWREFTAAQNGDRAESAAFQAPTLGVQRTPLGGLARLAHPLENPHFSFQEALLLYDTMTEKVFDQEFLAAFVEDSGGVFRRVTEAPKARSQTRAEAGHRYVMGVDWGKYNDFTALIVLDVTDMRQLEVCFVDRFNQIDYTLQMGRLAALVERFTPQIIVAEKNAAGEPLIEVMVRMGMPVWPFITGNATKALAIDGLSLALERGWIALPDHSALVNELLAYDAEKLPSGMLRYSAPEGMHDDLVVALALALWGASSPSASPKKMTWGWGDDA